LVYSLRPRHNRERPLSPPCPRRRWEDPKTNTKCPLLRDRCLLTNLVEKYLIFLRQARFTSAGPHEVEVFNAGHLFEGSLRHNHIRESLDVLRSISYRHYLSSIRTQLNAFAVIESAKIRPHRKLE